MADPHLLLVAGTGRSGTSTFVGVLRRHGFHVPEPEVAPDESNPRGFGEPQWVVDLHDRLLRRSGVQVADSRPQAWTAAGEVADAPNVRRQVTEWLGGQLEGHPQLVVKDPRSLWFLPLWRACAEELGVPVSFVTMLRPPPETVGSRRANYNQELQDAHGIASWLNLMTGTEHSTRGLSRSFVRYHDLLDDWSPVIDGVWTRNGLPGSRPAPDSDPGEFIDPGLRRHRLTWTDLELPSRLQELAVAADAALDALAGATERDEGLVRRLDEVRRTYADYYAEAEAVAHSSVIAARQRARRAAAAKPPPPDDGDSALTRVLSGLARRRGRTGS